MDHTGGYRYPAANSLPSSLTPCWGSLLAVDSITVTRVATPCQVAELSACLEAVWLRKSRYAYPLPRRYTTGLTSEAFIRSYIVGERDYPENSRVVFCRYKYVLLNLSCVWILFYNASSLSCSRLYFISEKGTAFVVKKEEEGTEREVNETDYMTFWHLFVSVCIRFSF